MSVDQNAVPSRRIILLNRFFYPDESATSQLLSDLAFHLAAHGRQVSVVTSEALQKGSAPLPRREEVEGVSIHRVPTAFSDGRSTFARLLAYSSFYPGALQRLLRLTRRGDIIVAKTDPPLISVAAWLVCRLRGARLINWIQDLYPEVAAELGTPIVRGPVGRLLSKVRDRALRFAAANVAIGTRMAERLRKSRVHPDRIAIIPNWSDETLIVPMNPVESASRAEWGLSPRDFVVGYSGNLGKAHEVETIVGAATLLRDCPEIKFLFIGGGRQHDRLEELIAREQLTSFIFKPHQPREQLGAALAAADVHWVSLRPELEGLIVPSKAYGILAAARPMIFVGDPNGELSRMIDQHGVGISIKAGDAEGLAAAILDLWKNPDRREQFGQSARAAIEHHYRRALALERWTNLLSMVPDDRPSAVGEGAAR